MSNRLLERSDPHLPTAHSSEACFLVLHGVQVTRKHYLRLFLRRAPNPNRTTGRKVRVLDLPRSPRESAPNLLVVVDLDRQSLAALLRDYLQHGSDRLPVGRPARPTAHDAP